MTDQAPLQEPDCEVDRMSVIGRGPWMLVLDNDGEPTEVVHSREAQDALDFNGVRMVEVVPTDQLAGAVERAESAERQLEVERRANDDLRRQLRGSDEAIREHFDRERGQ